VFNMSFSAHADSKGIMELLTHLEPKNVFLVHGEKQKMKVLAENVRTKLRVPCYYPPNHSVTLIETDPVIDLKLSCSVVQEHLGKFQDQFQIEQKSNSEIGEQNCMLVANEDQLQLMTSSEFE